MQNETKNETSERSGTSERSRSSKLGLFKILKGRNRRESLENYSIGGVVFGALLLSAGIGLTVLNPKGMSAIVAMIGALLSFVSSVTLVISWLLKELFG